jgi:hypothetical protein
MDVYAHLQQRLKREHGEAFDALIREAEDLMHGEGIEDVEADGTETVETPAEHDDETDGRGPPR